MVKSEKILGNFTEFKNLILARKIEKLCRRNIPGIAPHRKGLDFDMFRLNRGVCSAMHGDSEVSYPMFWLVTV